MFMRLWVTGDSLSLDKFKVLSGPTEWMGFKLPFSIDLRLAIYRCFMSN